ncbi:MAG: fused MFS/spermidine synthase [Desulfobulbus sp.]|nr:fused MFS/spermidine synthase [Desulfobulbus sp.]
MIIEMTGSRVLAPSLGSSLIVWTSLIGIILASISIGAWLGGCLADQQPHPRVLGRIILLASWATAAIGLSKTWVLATLQNFGDLQIASVTAACALFAPAALLLGMVPPFAIRLCLPDHRHSGRISGSIYAISSIGSIVGTFLAGFVLIAWVGSTAILFVTAVLLGLASWLVNTEDNLLKGTSVILFLLFLYISYQQKQWCGQQGFYDYDTPYNRVLIYTSKENSSDRLTREMVTGPLGRQSAMYLDSPTELVLPYTHFFRLFEYYQPQTKRMLVLGGGGYSFPKYALSRYADISIDVVEIDSEITQLARQHFGLSDHERLRLIEEDARMFLKKVRNPYDVIICDVFNSHYSIPFHLVTAEAMQLLRNATKPDGVILINLLASINGIASEFYKTMRATVSRVFPMTHSFAVTNPDDDNLWQNIILAAGCRLPAAAPADPDLVKMFRHKLPDLPDTHLLFTDDYAPVERMLRQGRITREEMHKDNPKN